MGENAKNETFLNFSGDVNAPQILPQLLQRGSYQSTKMLFCLFDADFSRLICICLSYEYLHMGGCFTSGYVLMRKI